ncbi:hypothetical protein HDU86_000177 [Geranomyces michiganensis]|nr:hypothetical protein HDU86_000177 [Geranomyces michiganensis]
MLSPEPPLASLQAPRYFRVDLLTPQFFFAKRAILRIDSAVGLGIDSTPLPSSPSDGPLSTSASSPTSELLDIATLTFRKLDRIDEAIAIDVGPLLGPLRIENPDRVFQLNTREGVFALRAQSREEKDAACGLVNNAAETKDEGPKSPPVAGGDASPGALPGGQGETPVESLAAYVQSRKAC